jgi:hypothetical protein
MIVSEKLPNDKDIFKKIDTAFESLDEQRAEDLKKLKRLQLIKKDTLEKERQRMESKYGADHPRVKKIASRITYNQGMMADLDMEIEKTDIEVPKHDGTTWTVHGRVFDENAAGIKDLTVSLYDDEGNWVREIEHTSTDESGYFAMTCPEEEKDALKDLEGKKLFLTITDEEHNVLHRESESLPVEIGRMRFREIVLTGKDRETSTPPEPGEGEPTVGPDVWMARGLVVDEKGQGFKGLVVSLYDRDLLFDDVLGTTLTDESGSFTILYRREAFRDLFEKSPDLYLKVIDNRGNELYSSKKAVRFKAGNVETFTVTIKGNADETLVSARKWDDSDDKDAEDPRKSPG